MVTIEQFAGMTRRIIAKDGFDDYLPTALYPARKRIVVLEGCPDDVEIEPVAIAWATRNAVDNEEFLVAFKFSSKCFKVVRISQGQREDAIFDVGEDV